MLSRHAIANRIAILMVLTFASGTVSTSADAACTDPNTCFGTGALESNTAGVRNSAFGYLALFNNVDGHDNSAFGYLALHNNTGFQSSGVDGSFNTAIGIEALFSNRVGFDNTATGAYALWRNVGYENTALGSRALLRNGSAIRNSAVGAHALESNVHGENNTALGAYTLYANETSSYNTAVGYYALQGIGGGGNTAIGAEALAGYAPSQDLPKRGRLNTAVGWQALAYNDSGSDNTASGSGALSQNVSGNANTATGLNALFSNTTGKQNTASGVGALKNSTTGERNVALGYQAGFAIASGSDNIIVGAANRGKPADTGVIRIGSSAYQKKAFMAGIRGVKTGSSTATAVFVDDNGQLGTIKSSREVKEDILSMGGASERIFALRPVVFRYKEADEDGMKPVQFGLIAEEVGDTFPELVIYDDEGKPETVSYHLLAALLLNELQKERAVTQSLQARVDNLESRIAALAGFEERIRGLLASNSD
jgi:hypothetical protein